MNEFTKLIDCKNCGESLFRHVGRSEMCPYERHGKFDYKAQGKAWPDKPTYFDAAEVDGRESAK
jgi:hypothetical protein